MNSLPTYSAQTPEAGLRNALEADRPGIIGTISASGLKGPVVEPSSPPCNPPRPSL